MYEEIRAKIAELKNKNEATDEEAPQYEFDVACGYDMALDDILSFLDTLEEDRPEPYNPVYDEAYLNEKIAKASKSWEGVDVDAMLDEGRGIEKSEKPTFLEEKEQVDLSPILQGYIPKIMWKFGMPEIERGAITETAYYFYELGRGHSEIPNNHDGLDEAAKTKYPKRWRKYPNDGIVRSEEYYDINAEKRDAFKHGAEWAFGQGLVYEGEVRHRGESGDTVYVEHPSTIRKKYAKMFKTGDKVIVQIRRKN